jgi:hypothetical protein
VVQQVGKEGLEREFDGQLWVGELWKWWNEFLSEE